jgi:hypothetical protein
LGQIDSVGAILDERSSMRRKGCKQPVFNLEDQTGIWTSV